ncbi:Mannose-6-phosphate isomerase [Eumeta japonica]|uniref:Mannose-6-phosphate isomerase n=1 Tax=Eumeta variegata TaxID=151549 RepID=A0A4C1SH62_EUMVA|nr:Mannose-6-phosphate isomerase [Eumeta japonica]
MGEQRDEATQGALMYPLISKLHEDFPGDVGCWAPYLMYYIQLKPGDAIYLASNLPHAYLSGDCVECMACSDNVIRAGLTPKFIDVPTLVEMLDYSSYTKDQLLFKPQLEDENSCVWRPPVPDFAVVKIKVEGGDSYNTRLRNSPSLLLIVGGEGEACDSEPIAVRPGIAIFLKASRQLTLTPKPDSYLETGPYRSGVNKSQPVRVPLRDVTNDNALGLEHPPSAYGIRTVAPAAKSHSRTVTSKRRTPGREFLLTIDILE